MREDALYTTIGNRADGTFIRTTKYLDSVEYSLDQFFKLSTSFQIFKMPNIMSQTATTSSSTLPHQIDEKFINNGITAFEPLSDVHTIMITGGGGFM